MEVSDTSFFRRIFIIKEYKIFFSMMIMHVNMLKQNYRKIWKFELLKIINRK